MTKEDEGRDLSQLIPFYLNGTISPADRARLEKALPASPRLLEELAAARSLAALVREGASALSPDDGPESRLHKVVARIDALRTARDDGD